MRGEDPQQQEMFLCASLEDLVPADHPLRPIRAMEVGRPSIAPERLLRA